MSALGHKQTCAVQLGDVRYVPITGIVPSMRLRKDQPGKFLKASMASCEGWPTSMR